MSEQADIVARMREIARTTGVEWIKPTLIEAADALATAEAAALERAAEVEALKERLEFFNHTFQPLVGLIGLAIAERDLDRAQKRFDELTDAWDRSLAPAGHSPTPAGEAPQTTACLSGIAANEPCHPDDTLKRCNLCGFIVDTKYAAEKPTMTAGKRWSQTEQSAPAGEAEVERVIRAAKNLSGKWTAPNLGTDSDEFLGAVEILHQEIRRYEAALASAQAQREG